VSLPSRKLSKEEKKKVIILDNEHRGEFDIDILANGFEDILKELQIERLLPLDIDFDDIGSTADRRENFKDMDVTCPKCGEVFKVTV